jgi:HlyD family secretion protein
VHAGDPLISIDDSVQRATTEQLRSQAEAALTQLKELKAEPRPETLAVAAAQVDSAEASLKSASDEAAKQERSYSMDPRSVSLDVLDNARNAMKIAAANLKVATQQFTLIKAGAWVYDIQNQEKQYIALSAAYQSANALLGKYTLHAPEDGVVLAINTATGSYVSPQGVYEPYSQSQVPIVVMGMPPTRLEVRVYIDEILVQRLPPADRITARMFIRGTKVQVPLTFTRIQPYVTPKIELSDQRLERVDLRVLPMIFRFQEPPGTHVYPGQLVDVYVGEK